MALTQSLWSISFRAVCCSQAQRQGSEQEVARLQAQAFEAINDSVRSASTDTLPLVAHLVPLMLTKLGSTMQSPVTSVDEHERQSELQAILCLPLPLHCCSIPSASSTYICRPHVVQHSLCKTAHCRQLALKELRHAQLLGSLLWWKVMSMSLVHKHKAVPC